MIPQGPVKYIVNLSPILIIVTEFWKINHFVAHETVRIGMAWLGVAWLLIWSRIFCDSKLVLPKSFVISLTHYPNTVSLNMTQ